MQLALDGGRLRALAGTMATALRGLSAIDVAGGGAVHDATAPARRNPMTRKRTMDRNSALKVVQIVQAEQQETAAPAPAVRPEKPRSTKERVNKAVMDLVLAEGLELSADDEAR